MSEAQLKMLDGYTRLMHTNAAAHVFRSAVELGIFEILASGPQTVSELAAAAKVDAGALELLLDALGSLGVIERYGDEVALAQVMHVLPPEFRDLGDRYWRHLTEYVRTGTPIPDNDAIAMDEWDFHIETASSEWMKTPAALDFVRVLDVGNSRTGLRVLDLRCGSAVWSLAVAHQDRQAAVTAVDSPERLAAARSHAEAIGVADRYEFIEGDYRSMDLPAGPFNLVILASASHLESLEVLTQVFRKVAGVLAPGGELALVDLFPGQEKGDGFRQLYQLELALRTSSGAVHGPGPLQAAFLAAGFDKPQFAHLPAPPYVLGLMLAARS